MELRFRLNHPLAELPGRANRHDAGFDLRAVERARLGPGERWAVPTGLAVEIPVGYAGLILPRSGLALRHGVGLANSPGLIDAGYRGEIKVLLINHDPADTFTVDAGDRIAQLAVVAIAAATPVQAERLSESDRAEGGFGSSGVA